MTRKNKSPIAIEVPDAVHDMSPKEVILLMRLLGVGKENYAPPDHARSWTSADFLKACTRDDVIRRAEKFPPERTTVDGWFSPKGPVPDDRRHAWHYFFHVFFSYERREFGTLAWKAAYFDALKREKIAASQVRSLFGEIDLPLGDPPERSLANILPLLRRRTQ
ncbi:MAG: hypothetical protein AAF566_03450 [Pseudomonadota bacterium]